MNYNGVQYNKWSGVFNNIITSIYNTATTSQPFMDNQPLHIPIGTIKAIEFTSMPNDIIR